MFIMRSGALYSVIIWSRISPCGSEKGSLAVENGLVEFQKKQNQQSS